VRLVTFNVASIDGRIGISCSTPSWLDTRWKQLGNASADTLTQAGMAGLFGSDTGQDRGSRCCTECRRDLWVLGVSQSAPSQAAM
jgi:hypothetical protein